MATDQPSSFFRQALDLAGRGDTIAAERSLQAAVEAARERGGEHSPDHSFAEYELGSLYLYLGQHRLAVEAMRRACEVRVDGSREAAKDRLTYRMNLGEMLLEAGQTAEAEQVLRESLEERRDFYGAEHPGVAYGLNSLAGLLLREGRFDEARGVADEAVNILAAQGHKELSANLALYAATAKAADPSASAFYRLADMPDDEVGAVVDAVIARLNRDEAPVGLAVIEELLAIAEQRFGPNGDPTLNLVTAESNLTRATGEHDRRERALRRLVDAYDAIVEDEMAVRALLGLGLAQSDAGRNEDALATYRDAVDRSRDIDDVWLESLVLRNLGLLQSEMGHTREAEDSLRNALGAARLTDDDDMTGRAEVALGIFLQHNGNQTDAEQFLRASIERLDAGHADALCARSHLDALGRGDGCGCGDMEGAICNAFRDYVLARIPDGLIESLEVGMADDGQFDISVSMSRKPTDDEGQLLQHVIDHAIHQFRQGLQDPY